MATIAENIQTLRSIKSDIKNAITDKGGSVGNDFKTYAQAITNLPSGGGGGTENEDGLIMRTISGTYYNDRVSMVGSYAFYSYSALKSVNLPNCISIGANAFAYCSLTSIDLTLCARVDSSAFAQCYSLINVNLPLCRNLGYNAFYMCKKLAHINLPLCDYIGMSTFYGCSALASIDLPLCTVITYSAFYNCNNLKEVYLNRVSTVTTIVSTTFSRCPNLTSVYVPASLVDAFKTAQYWSSISNKIVAYIKAPDPVIGGGGVGPIIN